MDRKLKQTITLQAAECVEQMLLTCEKGAERTPWQLIAEAKMEIVALEAIRIYRESVLKEKPSRN